MAGMQGENETRGGGVGGVVFAVTVIALMAYLSFAALNGEHGLFRLFQSQAQEKRLTEELAELRAARAGVANKTRRLSNGTLDLDLLDESARRTLGLGRADEMLIR